MRAGASRPSIAAIVLLFLLPLSGCSSSPAAAVSHGFETDLTYATGGAVHLRYMDTAELRDLDGQWITVRVLSINFPSELQGTAVYLLDVTGRVVATAGPCGDEGPDACETYTGVNWLYRGMLPPFGIGLRNHNNHVESWGGRHVSTIELHSTKSGRDVIMTADLEDAIVGSYPQGPFTFKEGEDVPNSAQWRTTEYRKLEPLPTAMQLQRPGTYPEPGTRHEFFPGSHENMFGTNFSFNEVIEAARQHAARAGTPIPAGSCGIQFVWSPPRLSTGLGENLSPKPGPEVDLAWRTPEGDVQAYRVQTSTDFLQNKMYEVTTGREQVRGTTCDQIAKSPTPIAGPNNFAERAQETAAKGTLTRFKWSVGLAGTATTRPTEAGWDLYEFYLEPPGCGTGCRLYQALYEPASGLLENIIGKPSDVLRFSNPSPILD